MASNTGLINFVNKQIKDYEEAVVYLTERRRTQPAMSSHYSLQLAAARGSIDAFQLVLKELGVKPVEPESQPEVPSNTQSPPSET
jgi:hypothetical protein